MASTKGRALLVSSRRHRTISWTRARGDRLKIRSQGHRVIGFKLLSSKDDRLVLLKEGGGPLSVTLRKYQVVGRGGKGHALFKRGRLSGMEPAELNIPVFQANRMNI